MADGFVVDASDLNNFAANLGKVPPVAGRLIRAAVEVSARHVKDEWKKETQGIRGAPAFPYSIGYDVKTAYLFGQTVVQAEIGPDKERNQGALGNLIEYGGETQGGLDSHRSMGAAALERTAADFERGLSKALEQAEVIVATDASVTASAAAVIRGSYF